MPPTSENAAVEKLSGLRKSAILLVILGEASSAEILKHLDDDEAQTVTREIAKVTAVQPEEAERVLEEFYQMSMAREYVLRGGVDYARKLLINAYGPDQAKKMLDRLMKALGSEAASFDALQKADPQQLAKFIHNEHPQTIALVLAHLNPSHAASLLFSLPSELRSDVSLRMANLDQISPEIITKIAQVIGSKLKSIGELSRESYGGVRAVTEMFNRLDSGTSKEILDSMDESEPQLVQTIRHLMFVFEDLLSMDEPSVKELLSRVDRKILTVALKGTSDRLKDHMLKAMSARGAEMMREDMESLGPIKIKEVETAQQQIIAVVRQLETEGVISLKGSSGEQYVV
jgi:flagellar motor switch protein FliG